jgi:hypothetical protein
MRTRQTVVLFMYGLVGVIHASVVVDDYEAFCGCIVLKSLNTSSHALEVSQYFQTITISPNDQAQCNKWTAFPNHTIINFPNRKGQPTSNFSDAVGIFAPDAYAFCGPVTVKQVCLPSCSVHTLLL